MSWYIWGVTSFDVPLLLDQSLICMKFSRYILTVLSVIRKLKAFWTLWPLVNPAYILTAFPAVMGGTHSVPLCSNGSCGWGIAATFAYVIFFYWSGSHLLSHAVSSIVPSAAQVLTIVFGMGTGVSPERIATGSIQALIAQQWSNLHPLTWMHHSGKFFSLSSTFVLRLGFTNLQEPPRTNFDLRLAARSH